MLRLDASRLTALGAPLKGGAVPIEEWLRALLRSGLVRLAQGPVELRGAHPVVTTLGDLKKACGVAVETVKQGLRPLEMDHWILLVDGAHTRLLGPPRFRVSVTKENFWGSVGQAVEVSVTGGLSPLESIDYDRLRRKENLGGYKRRLALAPLSLEWSSRVRLANGKMSLLNPGDDFVLAAGSHVRESGRSSVLQVDLPACFEGGRNVRTAREGELLLESGEPAPLPAHCLVQLERSSLIRLPRGQTGLLEIQSQVLLPHRETVDWNDDGYWLSRFRSALPLVLLRRAIFAELNQVVAETSAGVGDPPSEVWRVALGFHECILDGALPFRAGQCSLDQSPARLIEVLQALQPTDSLRQRLAGAFGFTVGAADVRISPAMFASAYDKRILQEIATSPQTNSEVLSLSNRVPCWSQVGAYYRKGDVWPWEVTREVYFTYVDVHYRQQTPGGTGEALPKS
jgi:hypothetical protein